MDLSTRSLGIMLNNLIKKKESMPIDQYICQMRGLKKLIDLSLENSLFQNSILKWVDGLINS
jgi:hypothetical protein